MTKVSIFILSCFFALSTFSSEIKIPCILLSDGQIVGYGTDWRFESEDSIGSVKVRYVHDSGQVCDLNKEDLKVSFKDCKITIEYKADASPCDSNLLPKSEDISDPYFLVTFEVVPRKFTFLLF